MYFRAVLTEKTKMNIIYRLYIDYKSRNETDINMEISGNRDENMKNNKIIKIFKIIKI